MSCAVSLGRMKQGSGKESYCAIVTSVLGLQDSWEGREDSSEKGSVGLLGGYPGETSSFPILTSPHSADPLWGSAGKDLMWVLAAVILSRVTFLSGPNAGFLGSFLCPCQLSAELLCREHTWHSSRAVTWTWRMGGGLVLLVDPFGL